MKTLPKPTNNTTLDQQNWRQVSHPLLRGDKWNREAFDWLLTPYWLHLRRGVVGRCHPKCENGKCNKLTSAS